MEPRLPAIEFDIDDIKLFDADRARVEQRIEKWSRGHRDITGASFAIRRVESDRTPHEFQARLVLYHRPENIAAHGHGNRPVTALKGALAAAERQLRAQRSVRPQRWRTA